MNSITTHAPHPSTSKLLALRRMIGVLVSVTVTPALVATVLYSMTFNRGIELSMAAPQAVAVLLTSCFLTALAVDWTSMKTVLIRFSVYLMVSSVTLAGVIGIAAWMLVQLLNH